VFALAKAGSVDDDVIRPGVLFSFLYLGFNAVYSVLHKRRPC